MKKSYICVKLAFDTPLHLSQGKGDYETSYDLLHSDSLKAALFVSGLQLGYDLGKDFFGKFRLSSGFPYHGKEYFFPRPMSPFPLKLGKDQLDAAKKVKKLQFIGKSYFEKVLKGDALSANERIVPKQHLLQGGKFLSSTLAENQLILKKAEQQRVTIPHAHTGEAPTPFYLERIFLEEGAGYYFLLEVDDDNLKKKLKAMLRLLGDQGIGTDRHVGNGLFTFDADKHWKEGFELEVPDNADRQVGMSLYLPEKTELSPAFLSESAYLLRKRGGWLASPSDNTYLTFRKRSVYMFSEGSVFPSTEKRLEGKCEDLKPLFEDDHPPFPHEVWRDGQALFLPMTSYTMLND